MEAEAQARQSKTNDVDQARHKLVRSIGAYLIIQAPMNDYIAGTFTDQYLDSQAMECNNCQLNKINVQILVKTLQQFDDFRKENIET